MITDKFICAPSLTGLENCPLPANITREEESCKLANRIRDIGQRSGIIIEFKAYIDTSDQPLGKKVARLQSELSSPGVTFVDCRQGGKKNAVDMRIIGTFIIEHWLFMESHIGTVDMTWFAADSQSPVTILLITGDGDYTFAVAKLIHHGHKVVVMGPSKASISLRTTSSKFLDWKNEVLDYVKQSSSHSSVVNEGRISPQVTTPGARSGGLDRAASPSPSDGSFVHPSARLISAVLISTFLPLLSDHCLRESFGYRD